MTDTDPSTHDDAGPVVGLLRRSGVTSARPAGGPTGDPADATRPDRTPADDRTAKVDSGDRRSRDDDAFEAMTHASKAWRFAAFSSLFAGLVLLGFGFTLLLVDPDERLWGESAASVLTGVGLALVLLGTIIGLFGYRSQLRRTRQAAHAPDAEGPTPSDETTNRARIGDLWKYYDEHASQTRQNESLRATAISIMSGFAGAMAALAGQDGLGRSDIPAAAIITVLGLLGFLLSLSHHAKSREHVRIMGVIREDIKYLGGADTDGARLRGVEKFEQDQSKDLLLRTAGWRRFLWALVPLLVSVAGVALIILSIVGVSGPD